MTDLSVVTLVKGRHAHLGRLLEGLQRGAAFPAEVIVVDLDATWSAPAGLPFEVRIVALAGGGLPLARARNAGARAARHGHLLFLDVDCIPRHELLPAIVAELTRIDALICAEVRYLGEHDVQAGWRESDLLQVGQLHPARSFPVRGVRRESNAGLFWSLAFGIRRDRFFSLGGFDEEFEGYGAEDTDFGFRAAAAGVELLFLGGTGAFHQYHAVFDPPLQHFADIVRNAIRFHAKWRVWPMRGWLQAFQAAGFIDFDEASLTILRRPTATDLEAVRSNARF